MFQEKTKSTLPFLSFCLFVGLCLTLSGVQNRTALAQQWRQFRGPGGNGHADPSAMNIATKWSESENVQWKVDIEGRGWSSPVISGNQIWLTTAIETMATAEEKAEKLKGVRGARQLSLAKNVALKAICIDRKTGKTIHNIPLFQLDKPDAIHSLNSYASPTPVIANGHVFCHFGKYGTASIQLSDGQIVWKKTGFEYDPQNGPGASPVVWKNLLLFNCDGRDVQFAVALNQRDGETVWKVDRSGTLNPNTDFKKAYCTPVIVEEGGRAQLISPAADWVYAYNPANGKELWKASYGELGFSTVPKPIVDDGKVYVLTSYMKSKLLAIKTDGTGDVSKSHIEWTNKKNMPQKPSLILVDGLIFAINDNGVLVCLDSKTGEQKWRERISGSFSASPIYAGGLLYFFSQDGETTVVEPSDTFKKIRMNKLDSGFMASPAVAGNTLFLRTKTSLYRIEN